jgi:hypothetical protein
MKHYELWKKNGITRVPARILIAFHPKALILFSDTSAGLLAFHFADAFPPRVTRDSGNDCQQIIVDYSCGDSSGFITGIPF